MDIDKDPMGAIKEITGAWNQLRFCSYYAENGNLRCTEGRILEGILNRLSTAVTNGRVDAVKTTDRE